MSLAILGTLRAYLMYAFRRTSAARNCGQIQIGIEVADVPIRIARRIVRLLEPVKIAVGHVQEIFAIEALVGQQGRRVDLGDTVAFLVQPRRSRLSRARSHPAAGRRSRACRLARRRTAGREVALHEAIRRLLPIQARLDGGRTPELSVDWIDYSRSGQPATPAAAPRTVSPTGPCDPLFTCSTHRSDRLALPERGDHGQPILGGNGFHDILGWFDHGETKPSRATAI